MTISRVGTSTGTNTAVPVAHAIGDLIIIAAFRATTGTPALPAGYTSITTKTGTSSSIRIGYRIATATNDAGGTWTNATATVCHVYRSSQYSSGGSVTIGANATNSSTTATVNFPALTMFHGDNTSWVLGFVGAGNLTQVIGTAPSGMTNESHETSATDQCAGHDTNGTVSSWSSTNANVTNTGNTVSATVELLENAPGTAVSNIVQHWSFGYDTSNASPTASDNFTFVIDPTLSGNGLVLAVAYPHGATPAITDDKSNTWPASGAAGTVTADAGAGAMALQVFRLASATTGTSQIKVSFGGSPQRPVKVWITQLYNITGTVNGSANAAGVNAGGVISPGAMTPTNNNANGGNLILSYMCEAATSGSTNPSLIIAETGYGLNDADIAETDGNGIPNASQFWLQATSAATTPRFYVNIAGTDTYNVVAIALSVGTQGTPKPSGAGVAPWIDKALYYYSTTSPAAWKLQIPSTGNCGVLQSSVNAVGVGTSASATDSDGTAWTKVTSVNGGQTPYYRPNYTPNFGRTLTVATTANSLQQAIFYDLSNCDPSPLVASASGVNASTNNTNSVATQPSITPTATNQLTLAFYANSFGPTLNPTSPSGATVDNGISFTAQFTATIATTTLTVSATAWGTIENIGNVISGSGVTLGTTVQAGTGPTYTIQPSQTVAVGVTMLQTTGDNNSLNYGDTFAHFFNGGSTSAQNWTWNIANGPSTTGQGNALIFKGPSGVAVVTGWQPVSDLGPPPGAIPWLGSSFVPFNTPQTVVTAVPQGWESILTPTPAVARVATPAPSLIVPLPPIFSGWQSTLALAPAVVQPQSGYSFVPFNTAQTNTATIDKWQQPLSIPVLAPPVQLGATFVPFNTLQLNTAPLGWYQALSITPPPLPAQLGSISLSYNIAPTINTIPGMGWFQALATTPASAPIQLGASFVPFNTPQTTTTVSPWGWYQPLSLAPAVATAVATQPTWVPAPFPTFSLAWQQPLSIAPPVTTAVYTQSIWTPIAFPTFTLAWQQPLASTPTSQAAQLGTTVLPYKIAPLANTIPGMGWYQPLSTAPAVAIADQSSTFVPFNTPQVIVVSALIQRTLTGVGL